MRVSRSSFHSRFVVCTWVARGGCRRCEVTRWLQESQSDLEWSLSGPKLSNEIWGSDSSSLDPKLKPNKPLKVYVTQVWGSVGVSGI